MPAKEVGGIKRLPPKRTLDKKEATRRLIHSSCRMIAAAEDPFAIHLLVQSADKLLIDLSKAKGKPLAHDWTTYIKPEYRGPVLRVFRETYNYFKHADEDHDELLHVGAIVESNILQLAVCCANYHSVFGEWTDHMKLLFNCAKLVLPDGFVLEQERPAFNAALPSLSRLKFREFFNPDIWQANDIASVAFPRLMAERAEDLAENDELFGTYIGNFPLPHRR